VDRVNSLSVIAAAINKIRKTSHVKRYSLVSGIPRGVRALVFSASLCLCRALQLTLFVTFGTLHAQSAMPPAFEVASVKQDTRHSFVRRPWSPNIDCGPIAKCGIIGDRFNDEFASLTDLIMDAYKVRRYQVLGLPDWGDTGHDVYDVEAKIGSSEAPTLDQARLMLQTLLTERFQLKIHHETRELPVYALVVTKNGPKLAPTDKVCAPPAPPGSASAGRGGKNSDDANAPRRSLSLLESWVLIPERLAGRAGRPIVDKTGFDATAYCTLDGMDPFAVLMREMGPGGGGGGRNGPPRAADAAEDPGARGVSLFTAIEEKWGLKLEPQKGPVDVLVIDHVERPSEN
jgi:uncharacterized protein (TIGR03435 family)